MLRHELVHVDDVVEWPERSVVHVNVDNLTIELSRIQYL